MQLRIAFSSGTGARIETSDSQFVAAIANAALAEQIVRRCNAFSELVSTLESARTWVLADAMLAEINLVLAKHAPTRVGVKP